MGLCGINPSAIGARPRFGRTGASRGVGVSGGQHPQKDGTPACVRRPTAATHAGRCARPLEAEVTRRLSLRIRLAHRTTTLSARSALQNQQIALTTNPLSWYDPTSRTALHLHGAGAGRTAVNTTTGAIHSDSRAETLICHQTNMARFPPPTANRNDRAVSLSYRNRCAGSPDDHDESPNVQYLDARLIRRARWRAF
jgi:hypothetical protein